MYQINLVKQFLSQLGVNSLAVILSEVVVAARKLYIIVVEKSTQLCHYWVDFKLILNYLVLKVGVEGAGSSMPAQFRRTHYLTIHSPTLGRVRPDRQAHWPTHYFLMGMINFVT